MMVAVAHREWRGVTQRFLAILVFLFATRLGFLLGAAGRSKAPLFFAQALLLLPLFLFHTEGPTFAALGIALLCAILGLQNGAITTIHNVSIHSTFLSGDFTKLLKAFQVGSVGSDRVSTEPTVNLLPLLIFGFAIGALGAASIQIVYPAAALYVLLSILAFACLTTLLPVS